MFGFFKKRSASAARGTAEWTCWLNWRVLTYQEGLQHLSLQVEPMSVGPCRVYVPGDAAWRRQAPAWAQGRREQILQRARSIAWNRDLDWPESERATVSDLHAQTPVPGSLESTKGGQQLQALWLFHPDSPARWSKADSKRAWIGGAEQMCLQAAGEVPVHISAVIPGSVFQAIELPALRRNPQVRIIERAVMAA